MVVAVRLDHRPRSPLLNAPIGGARHCAAQSWPLQRIRAVKGAAGASVNDVVLALCAGALRTYLIERDALPEQPLVAMVPVSLRTKRDGTGGNQVGAALRKMATHLDDPAPRLATIHESMQVSKKVLAQLPRAHAAALSLMMAAPAALAGLVGRSTGRKLPDVDRAGRPSAQLHGGHQH